MKSRYRRVILVFALFICGCVAGVGGLITFQQVRMKVYSSLVRRQADDLWGAYSMWVEAGKLSGKDLVTFLKEFNQSEVKHIEKEIQIGEKAYRTFFCDTDLSPYADGVLFVTREGTVIWERTASVLFENPISSKD